MMHAVHDAISPWAEIGRTLGNISEYEKEFFPKTVHRKSLVRSVPMKEKSLGKQRQIPMPYEK
jgi:hypothetical protein